MSNQRLTNKELGHIFAPIYKLDPEKISVFVHGSWADNSRTAFSDLDDFIIIDDAYYSKVKAKLDEVEMQFQKIDLLQHHGHWLVKKSFLNNYDDSYMPLFLMDEAIFLFGNQTIDATIDPYLSNKNRLNAILNTCRYIVEFYEKWKNNSLNIYNLKKFVGSIVLLPPLLFQQKGEKINKKQAILNSNLLFENQKSLEVIQWSTDCRNNWSHITESTEFKTLSSEVTRFKSAQKWREYVDKHSPILNYENLSPIKLDEEMVKTFVNECLKIVDSTTYLCKTLEDYSLGYKKLENFCIENKAILIGQFGNIKYPSISDLDVLICFEDRDYAEGCYKTDHFIKNDSNLSYLFAHEPLYIPKSFLNKIKYLHTLYDLKITYNKYQEDLSRVLTKDYEDFLSLVWAFSFHRFFYHNIHNIKYTNIRQLLLILKNIQTTLHNIESRLMGIKSDELNKNHASRISVLKNGIIERENIENEIYRCYQKLNSLLSILNKKGISNKIPSYFKVGRYTFVNTNQFVIKDNIFELPNLYYILFYNILKTNQTESDIYKDTIRHYFKLISRIKGHTNWHISILPIDLLKNSWERNFIRLFKNRYTRKLKASLSLLIITK